MGDGQVPSPPRKGSGTGIAPTRKNDFFSLEIACFGVWHGPVWSNSDIHRMTVTITKMICKLSPIAITTILGITFSCIVNFILFI